MSSHACCNLLFPSREFKIIAYSGANKSEYDKLWQDPENIRRMRIASRMKTYESKTDVSDTRLSSLDTNTFAINPPYLNNIRNWHLREQKEGAAIYKRSKIPASEQQIELNWIPYPPSSDEKTFILFNDKGPAAFSSIDEKDCSIAYVEVHPEDRGKGLCVPVVNRAFQELMSGACAEKNTFSLTNVGGLRAQKCYLRAAHQNHLTPYCTEPLEGGVCGKIKFFRRPEDVPSNFTLLKIDS